MKNAIPLVLVFLAVGCFKPSLTDESVIKVNATGMDGRTLDAIPKAQTIKVSAKANSGVFNVYIFLKKDTNAVEKDVDAGKVPAKVLAQRAEADGGPRIDSRHTRP